MSLLCFYQSFVRPLGLHLPPVSTGSMKGSVIQLFLAAIFCAGACSMLFQGPQDIVRETRPSVSSEFSFENVEHKYPSEDCSISAPKTHNYSGFLRSFLVWEVEENDDEKEVSDFPDEQRSLLEAKSEAAIAIFLRQSNYVPSVPLFIFLHSWKHFLS
jgi:hypothetical protein